MKLNEFSENREFINFAYAENAEYPIFFRIPRELPLDRDDRPLYPFSNLERSHSFPYLTSCWFSPELFPERFLDYTKIFLSGRIESIDEEALVFEVSEPKDATHFLYLIDFYREHDEAELFGASVRASNSLVLFKFIRSESNPTRPVYTYCLVTKADVSVSFGEKEDEIFLVPTEVDFQAYYENKVEKEARTFYEEFRRKEAEERRKEEQEKRTEANKKEIERLIWTKFRRYGESNFRKLPEIIRSELGREDKRFDYSSKEFDLEALEEELWKAAGVYDVIMTYRPKVFMVLVGSMNKLIERGLTRLELVPDYDFSGTKPFLKLTFVGLEREVMIKPKENEPFVEGAIRIAREEIAKLLKELTRKELVSKTLARLAED